MKRLLFGMTPLLMLVGVVGCNSDSFGDLQNGMDHLEATPTQLFIELGATKTVVVGGVDAQGNPQEAHYDVTAVGTGISVERDTTFRPIYVNDSVLQVPDQSPTFRFIVTGNAYTATSFTVTGGGKQIVIPVQVVPNQQIAATFDNATPLLGDTVTITAPAGTTFSQTSELFFGDISRTAFIVERDPNGQFIRFIPPPSVNGPVGITEVTSVSAPDLQFTPLTSTPLITPLIDTVDVNYSTTTPTLGQTVTMTILTDPVHVKFATIDSITYPGQLTGPSAGPQAITVAADSGSLSFEAPPNVNGAGLVTSFTFPGGYVIALPTRPNLTGQFIGLTVDATFSDSTPALFDPITVTLPAGFHVGAAEDVVVDWGGLAATINSVGGGGSTIDITPAPGSNGTATITGVFPTAAPQFVLAMPTVHTISVPPLTPLEGTDDPATAPTFDVPGTLADAGSFGYDACGAAAGFPCQVYRMHVATGGTFHFKLRGSNAADLGLYFLDVNTLAQLSQVCDNLGRASPPEECDLTFAAGDYIMGVVTFGPGYPENDPNPSFIVVDVN
jgi:hypothetical protein